MAKKSMILCIAVLALAGISSQAPAEDITYTDYLRALQKDAADQNSMVIEGKDGWLFFVPELRHLTAGIFWGEAAQEASRASNPDARDPLPALLDFDQALKKQNVHLLLVPVPAKASVYPDQLPGAPPTPTDGHSVHTDFYDMLRSNDVDVLDLTGLFRNAEGHAMYCRQDTHWSGAACVLAAKHIAERLDVRAGPAEDMAAEWRDERIEGDLWRMLNQPDREAEILPLRVISQNNDPVKPDPNSPVLVLGDSHGLVFHAGGDMHYRGAGLADQLAYELGSPVDVVAVRGSGATPARINVFRRAQRDPSFWNNKRVVIWVFSVREFTESDGWRIIPIAP